MRCKCGNKIKITVPMYVNKEGDYICKDCFDNIKITKGVIDSTINNLEKLEELLKKNLLKRKINDQIDLLIDDFRELLKELRTTQKPLSKERREYFFGKLDERQKKIHKIAILKN